MWRDHEHGLFLNDVTRVILSPREILERWSSPVSLSSFLIRWAFLIIECIRTLFHPFFTEIVVNFFVFNLSQPKTTYSYLFIDFFFFFKKISKKFFDFIRLQIFLNFKFKSSFTFKGKLFCDVSYRQVGARKSNRRGVHRDS